MIDIGGPSLLRAGAKNHKHILVACDPSRYVFVEMALRDWNDEMTRQEHLRSFAFLAFQATATYDARVATWLSTGSNHRPTHLLLTLFNWGRLRYGENPHQTAELLHLCDTHDSLDLTTGDCCADQEDAQGTFSHNNFLDASGALELCAELTRAGERLRHRLAGTEVTAIRDIETTEVGGSTPTVCFIKHTNACGVGIAQDPVEAYRKAYLGDPNAAMGGILAVNFGVTPDFAEAVMETYQRWGKAAGAGAFFVEVLLAPCFEEKAVDVIRARKEWGKRVRLLGEINMNTQPDPKEMDFKRIAGGMLMQNRDLVGLNDDQWKVVTQRQPTEAEMDDLRLAWLVCKHTKSNAITICRDGMLIGNGAGQMSRVMSCRIATWLAKENGHADKLAGAVAASDAFFPFRDGPGILMEAGVTAIIQPGGSKRDEDTIAACNERGVAMIFTGTRHFKH
jgi:phosphoribosylaminoimidazolecarboxamide formyltransferase/IMP cyclohydrolase